MRIFSKLLVLGAALAVSTSMAYADNISALSISTDVGVPVSYSSTGVGYGPAGVNNAFIQNASGAFASFLGDNASLNGLAFQGGTTSGTVMLFGGKALVFTADNGALDYYLTSGTWSIYGNNELSVLGSGYFDVNGVRELGGITITGSDNGIFNVETTGSITPEPGSLILLGTGLLSAAGIARRKFASKLS